MATSIASSGEDSIRKTIHVGNKVEVSEEDLRDIFEVDRCLKWIKEEGVMRVALQFPNELLSYAAKVVMMMGQLANPARVYVLADSTYGSCCVDEKTAAHMNADSLIHFGHYCGSCKSIKMPVLYVLVRPKINSELMFQNFVATYPEKKDRIGILYDYEFFDTAHLLLNQVNEAGFSNVVLLAPESLENFTEDVQVLEFPEKCFYLTSTEGAIINRIMQVNKCFSKSRKDAASVCGISVYDPTRSGAIATPSINKLLMKRNYYIEKLREADTIGILVGTLSMDSYLDVIKHLKSIIRRVGKRCFVVSIGEINAPKLANFPDIHAFVLVACPEATLIESKEFYQVVATPWEVEMAFGRENLTADYFVDYRVLLPEAKEHIPFEQYRPAGVGAEVSLLSGVGKIDIRWQGLEDGAEDRDNQLKIHEGQKGIARHYISEPTV